MLVFYTTAAVAYKVTNKLEASIVAGFACGKAASRTLADRVQYDGFADTRIQPRNRCYLGPYGGG
jgi:hypothetical protein